MPLLLEQQLIIGTFVNANDPPHFKILKGLNVNNTICNMVAWRLERFSTLEELNFTHSTPPELGNTTYFSPLD